MPSYGRSDISERLRSLINARRSADREQLPEFEIPSEPEFDPTAPAFPDIEAIGSVPDPDYVNPFTKTGGYSPEKKPPTPRVGQFYGRG